MTNETKNIICPNCSQSISIDDVLTSQIESKLRKEIEGVQKIKEAQLAEEYRQLAIAQSTLELAKQNTQIEVTKKVNERLATEKITLWKQAQAEASKAQEAEKQMLGEQLADKDARIKEANLKEIELRKDRQRLKDEKEAFEIDKARQLDEERMKIGEIALKKATDLKQSEIDQLNKKVSDVTRVNDELARKLAQGSQQTQGEVQEIILEELLKAEFIHDDILPVAKGVKGADVLQIVKTKSGIECGTIIWESKKSKGWKKEWIQILKDNQRSAKAEIAVIVSSILPEGVNGIGLVDGVWICDINLSVSIATALRHSLESLAREKAMSIGKNEKVEMLYAYLTGTEFTQRISSIVETFSAMKSTLDKERLLFEKSWAERDKQIQKVLRNVVGIYGDLDGVVQLQKIEALELSAPKEE